MPLRPWSWATAPAGQEFFYNTGALTLMSAIVRKAVGRPLDEFAREALFAPLGITDFEWIRVKGDTDAGGGLRLRPRDMAKIGQLALAGGRWNDRQIVSKAWIDASMTPRLEATDLISMAISGGSAAPCTMGVKSIGPPRSVAAGSRFASCRSSISSSW